MYEFYRQVQEFCLLMFDEVARQWSHLPETVTSPGAALAFTEKFLLCPTTESARCCIENDFPGAMSFAVAMDGVNQKLQNGSFRLPAEWPVYQTRFYVLSCAVQEYIRSLPE